ncbi:hypothetical protein K469DRAFT_592734, partial [Zopfia rhizophila CBS 207.26]
SLITIVAASGMNTISPLPGVRPRTRAPQYSRKAEGSVCEKDKELVVPLVGSIYESLGWTFQERILSRGYIFLTDLGALLLCPSFLYSERYGNLPVPGRQIHPLRRLALPNTWYHPTSDNTFVNVLSYCDLVIAYTKKSVTYFDDILRAFAGIVGLLEQRIKVGQMVLGLLTNDFTLGLSWIQVGSLTRRLFCTSPSSSERLPLGLGWLDGQEGMATHFQNIQF